MDKFIKGKELIKEFSKVKPHITVATLYEIVVCIALILLIIIAIFQNVDIYKVRQEPGYKTVEDSLISEIEDEDAPLGIKKQYKWTLEDIVEGENYLAFYVVHQYVEVYFDKKLVYSIKLEDENKIGKTTASNWVMIPLYPEDKGTEVTINIIPVYEAVRDRIVKFFIGSKFIIYFNQLKEDLPQIILSLIAISIGIIFVAISIFHIYKRRENDNLTYLGIFSIAIGIWKIMDIRFAPLMFTKNTMLLSYISITMISIAVVSWMLSIKKQFLRKSYTLLECTSVLSCLGLLFVVILQVTNIADLRETLWLIHIIIAIIALGVVGTVIYEGRNKKIDKKTKILYSCFLLCAFGVVTDIMFYYINGNSAGILYTLIAFIIYIITMGYISIRDINRKANIDMHTGVFNKSCCNEMLDENEVIKDSLGIMMFDLNRLKYTNDTFGHENGDILISEFANTLKKNIPNRDFVGRYGGDEFIVIIKNANEERMQQVENNISKSVAQYNIENNIIPISYSAGYALSNDYPGGTLRELLKKADNNMYRNKKAYHNRNKY